MQERRQVRLFLRPDAYLRFTSCLVYLPRDRYSTDVRMAIERVLLREYDAFPELYESLIYRRNRDWIPQLLAKADSGRNVLVVVGAMHLVGERGVIAMLRKSGLDPQPAGSR